MPAGAVALDLRRLRSGGRFFASLAERAKKVAVMSEGLLIYFATEDVASLARDLAGPEHFRSWIVDLASPGTTEADAALHWKRVK